MGLVSAQPPGHVHPSGSSPPGAQGTSWANATGSPAAPFRGGRHLRGVGKHRRKLRPMRCQAPLFQLVRSADALCVECFSNWNA